MLGGVLFRATYHCCTQSPNPAGMCYFPNCRRCERKAEDIAGEVWISLEASKYINTRMTATAVTIPTSRHRRLDHTGTSALRVQLAKRRIRRIITCAMTIDAYGILTSFGGRRNSVQDSEARLAVARPLRNIWQRKPSQAVRDFAQCSQTG